MEIRPIRTDDNMIWKLHEKFGIPAESLIRPSKTLLAA